MTILMLLIRLWHKGRYRQLAYAFQLLKKIDSSKWFLYELKLNLQFWYYNYKESQHSPMSMIDSYLKKKKIIDVISISSD